MVSMRIPVNQTTSKVFFGVISFLVLHSLSGQNVEWTHYLGDKHSRQYSAANQITAENISKLTLTWSYTTGGLDKNDRSQIQCNPIMVGGILYGTTPDLKIFALDAKSGAEIWTWDPKNEPGLTTSGVNRGLVYWPKEKRILYGNDRFLHALDAKSGKRVRSFGDGGSIDLKKGLGRNIEKLQLQANTPGIIFKDKIIIGMRLGEGPAPAAPGHIRAYNLYSGELEWRFNTIPQPGEFGYETWPPNAYRYIGGANVWAGFSVDEERGIIFCPTGSAAFDFWGGNRLGDNLYSNCLVALDANTGKRIWHYQFVRHDLWDRDLPAPPNLMTITRGRKKIDVVAQITKSGHVFVFDRENGEPIYPIKEIRVPPSTLEGEATALFQPIPTKPLPFSRQLFTYDEINDISPEIHADILERFSRVKPHTPFMPPSMEGTIIFPGFDGGGEWGGAAADPNGILYINANEMPWILTMVKTKNAGEDSVSNGEAIYTQICAVCHGVDRMGNTAQKVPSLVDLGNKMKKEEILKLLETGRGVMPSVAFLKESQREAVVSYLLGEASNETKAEDYEDRDVLGRSPYSSTGYHRFLYDKKYPAVKPPWGTLNAIDINTGEYLWKVPLGEWPDLAEKGIHNTGTENYGGPAVTAGGLVFIAASRDEHIRAFDQKTGKELWKFKLPAAGYATPTVYSIDGKQFVVIACGGGKIGTKSGESYLAFSLSKE